MGLSPTPVADEHPRHEAGTGRAAGSNKKGSNTMRTRRNLRRGILGLALLLAGSVFVEPVQARLQGPDLRLSERLALATLRGMPILAPDQHVSLRLSENVSHSLIRDLVLARGEAMVGTSYVYGADREDAVDCSALVQRMYRSAGIEVPRTTREQLQTGNRVHAAEALVEGDLLFYRWGRSGLHVAVYLPGNRILHASPGQGEVVVSPLNAAWKRRLVGARRLI
jgi:lipoprotein Spr